MNLLTFETSSSRCGVALLRVRDGHSDIQVMEHEGAQEHAERLLPMATSLLQAAGVGASQLTAIAYGRGPGGFTGLRVACGVAQGIALGLAIPVVGVVSHLAVAADVRAGTGDVVAVALDARMSEVYLAVYRGPAAGETSGRTVLQAPILIAAAQLGGWLRHHLTEWSEQYRRELRPVLAGDAWLTYAGLIDADPGWARADVLRPGVAAIARLAQDACDRGETQDPADAAPLYVRDKVAFTTLERQRGEGGNPRARAAMLLARATAADLDGLAALEREVQAFPWTRGNFADALAAGYDIWTLKSGEELAGFCIVMSAPDAAHLLVIAIRPGQHRLGLGSRLLALCELRARERELEGIVLEVRPSNKVAIAFYERHGFARIGMRKNYYSAADGKREDAWVMCKSLLADGA